MIAASCQIPGRTALGACFSTPLRVHRVCVHLSIYLVRHQELVSPVRLSAVGSGVDGGVDGSYGYVGHAAVGTTLARYDVPTANLFLRDAYLVCCRSIQWQVVDTLPRCRRLHRHARCQTEL